MKIILLLALTLFLVGCEAHRRTMLVACPSFFSGVRELDFTLSENSSSQSSVYAVPPANTNTDILLLIPRTHCEALIGKP